ncbi:6-phosphogluconolactonase [uncultured Sphingomonas sp.]|uniref:6-phosphogluconolactonase n=1 Tax=uncultured Sphingomonas sp. TaxID=158754 RepID=UPI0025CFC1C6|nr:6-phosphogluconolactonase [uncultured Sphingomonas sp.]
MTRAEWRCHDDPGAFAEAVAGDVSVIVRRSVGERGRSLLALPGGSTPRPIFRHLAAAALPWEAVTLIPTDERLVELGLELSNARLLKESFAGTDAKVVPIADGEPEPGRAGDVADARLQELPWPPALVWLGMGEDGHTASIFAGPDLQAALDAPAVRRAVGVRPDPLPPEAPVARVTLTRSAIASADAVLVSITGEKKRALLEQALTEGSDSDLPIGRVLADLRQPPTIHWCSA